MFPVPIFSSNVGVDGGDIGHSLRCRSAASAYLSKTIAASANPKQWTFSFWAKRGAMGAALTQALYSAQIVAGNSEESIAFYNDVIRWADGAAGISRASSALFRDGTSHLHFVVVYDSPNATDLDRLKLYANGSQISFTGSAITQNRNSYFTTTATNPIALGRFAGINSNHFDGYLSRIAFVDGSSLTPSSFGYFNTEINEWVSKSQSQVKAVVDAGGANSFMLDFDDATSLTTLGQDNSSKGNNWTLNNFSLTAGSTYDHMLDVPGNSYATLNPLYKLISPPIQANLAFTSGAGWRMQKGPELNTGKWYVECVWTSVGASNTSNLGLILPSTAIDVTHYAGMTSTSWGLVISSTYAYVYTNAAAIFTQAGTYNAASTGKLAVDFDAGKCWIGYNDSWFGGGDPAAGTSPTVTFTPNTAYCIGMGVNANTTHFVSGAAPLQTGATYQTAAGGYFTRAVPAGFLALCQANMPEPAIKNPKKHFDVVLATGANIKSTAEAVFPSNFLEWIKDRANSNNHQLIDTVRGTSAVLQSNTTAAETTYSAPSGSSVGWLWKAGGAAVTNNAGSISSQVSANVEAGFSIVTYTGNLSASGTPTVGHGLGVAPKMIITKARVLGTDNGAWAVWHSSLPGASYSLYLNATNAQSDTSANGAKSLPTATVFSTNWSNGVNINGAQYVAYCFAEIPGFSRISSYVGNGSTDGPYVECGFKPKFVMIRSSTAADAWKIYDAARPGYNVQGGDLKANTTGVETVAAEIDFTASGFKLRVATTPNAAQPYIFIAFADVPAKYSLSR